MDTQLNIQMLAELVAKHYSVEKYTRTIPARTETIEETVAEERYPWKTRRMNRDGLWNKLKLAFVWSLAILTFLFTLAIEFIPDASRHAIELLKCKLRCRGDQVCVVPEERLRRIHRSVSGMNASIIFAGEWAWKESVRRFREKMFSFFTFTERTTMPRQVLRTVTRDVETAPEEVVEDSVPGKNRILAFGNGHIEFQAHQTNRGVFVTGPSALMDSDEIRYPMLADGGLPLQINDTMEERLQRVPWVLDGQLAQYPIPEEAEAYYEKNQIPLRGFERELLDYSHEMGLAFADRQDAVFRGVAVTDSRLLREMLPIAETDGKYPPPDITLYESGPGGSALDVLAKSWPVTWSAVSDALFETRLSSLRDELAAECMDMGTFIGYSAFNFYCPRCNEPGQEELLARDYAVQAGNQDYEPISFSSNSRCLFDPDEDIFRCITCEYETSRPIPMHKVLDEVLLPAYDHLMNEHKVERLRAHQDVRTREIENRNSLETEIEKIQIEYLGQIDLLTEEMERLRVDAGGERMAIEAMQDILDAYDIAQNSVMNGIRASSAQTDMAIQERTDRVLANVDEVKQQEMEALNEELTYLSQAKRKDDERRDAVQREIVAESKRQTGIQQSILSESEKQTGIQRDTLSENKKHSRGLDKIEKRVREGNGIQYAHARGEKPRGHLNPEKNAFQRLFYSSVNPFSRKPIA